MLFCNTNKLKWVVFFFSSKLLVYTRLIWIEHVETEDWSLFCKCLAFIFFSILIFQRVPIRGKNCQEL